MGHSIHEMRLVLVVLIWIKLGLLAIDEVNNLDHNLEISQKTRIVDLHSTGFCWSQKLILHFYNFNNEFMWTQTFKSYIRIWSGSLSNLDAVLYNFTWSFVFLFFFEVILYLHV